jgi:hypothetical protein
VPDLRTARVLGVDEEGCELWSGAAAGRVRFAPMFPSPRAERVSPGDLVAVAAGPQGAEAIVWRWFDAVVLGPGDGDTVRLWEPLHGEVAATPRPSYVVPEPGSRVYASAGLPGAEWWLAGTAEDVELAAVHALYDEHDLWESVFA